MTILAQEPDRVNAAVLPWEGHKEAQYYCFRAKRYFRSVVFRYMRLSNGMITVWVDCAHCDQNGRLRGEAGYDRERPQPHMFALTGAPEEAC
jgi:hypothetical protein